MDSAAADDRPATGAGAQFCQSHPNRHRIYSFLITPAPFAESPSAPGFTGTSYAYRTQKKGLTAIPLTLNIMFKVQEKLLFAESKWLTSHYGTVKGAGLNVRAGQFIATWRKSTVHDNSCHPLGKMD
ncbi:hypothetical protein [Sphingobium sp. WCS2017Hpa-17]|uniref:hypothetical protein n=1 Tax=Sphingobium sp. WCS2017Hpa-17 TaxID=3073638 RepID=UPI0028892D41|nr:hypothetical protein [Sphingobium sp. WCS2017Hpa-17]